MQYIIYLLHAIGVILFASYLLWVFYVAIMRLKMVRDAGQLTKPMLYMSYPTLILGYALDFLVNTILGSIFFLELPQELTLSSRLTRWASSDSWHGKLAINIRAGLLDNIDPNGIHGG